MCLNRISKPNLLAVTTALLSALVSPIGCAKPQGVLFPAIETAMVWPAAPSMPRIKYIGQVSDSRDLRASQSSMEVFKSTLRGPRPPIRFSGVHGVAMSSQGVLAVADAAGAGLHLIDLNTREHRFIGGWDDERLAVPVTVAWVSDRVFVVDAGRHEIIEFNLAGQFVRRFGATELTRPVGITFVAEKNQLYVVDGGAHRLVTFDLEGQWLRTIGERGSEPGQFNFPSHMASQGSRLLVADSGNFRVQLLDLDGHCVRTIGQKGDAAGDFALPKGVAFDGDGHIYVVDAQFENVQVFDQQGQLLMAWGDEGSGVGQFSLPAGIGIDDRNRIWVADSGNRRVQVFSYIGANS